MDWSSPILSSAWCDKHKHRNMTVQVVNEVVNLMAAEAEGVVAACGLPPIMPDGPPPVAAAGRVSDRLGVVWQLLGGLCGELLTCRGPQTLHMDS